MFRRTNNLLFIFPLIGTLLGTGCQQPGIKPLLQVMATEEGMQARVGFTSSTQTTQSAAQQAAGLYAEIESLRALLPAVQENEERFDAVTFSLNEKMRLYNVLLEQAERGEVRPLPLVEGAPDAFTHKKTMGQHASDTFADYSNKWEGFKSTGAQAAALAAILTGLNAGGVVKIRELPGYQESDESERELAAAATALAESDKNSFKGRDIEVRDAPQSARITAEGENILIDFQQDTQDDPTVIISTVS